MEKSKRLALLRQVKITKASRSFWEFCKLIAPDFYMEKRWHLKVLCETLQAFYEGRIVRCESEDQWRITYQTEYGVEHCSQLYVQMPPRLGKTRTITMFCAWILGKEQKFKFMYTSYNDDAAADTSRYVKNTIEQEKLIPTEFVYSDIFDAKMEKDNKGSFKWALEGQYFNFIAAGRGGSVTGKGADMLIVDDPVKNAEVAMNDAESEKTWSWYKDTLLSRLEEGGKILVNHTRWPKEDLIFRLKETYGGKRPDYYELVLRAYDDGKMLCPDLLSLDSYLAKKKILGDDILEANYNQNVQALKGRLYRKFLLVHKRNEPDSSEASGRYAYCDYADSGMDYMCLIIGDIYSREQGDMFYIQEVLYTQESVDEYIDEFVDKLIVYEVDNLLIESNNGGKNFAIEVENRINKRGGSTVVQSEYRTANKETRILTNANMVQDSILYPEDWETLWPEFSRDVKGYSKEGKNKHDDAPDCLTSVVEDLMYGGVLIHG